MLVAIFGVLRGASRLHQIETILSLFRERSRSEMLGRGIFWCFGKLESFLKKIIIGKPN
jgi:hypothetical protein